MKHTPGPWKVIKNPMRHDGWFVQGPKGEKGITFTQTSEADARLIASAPELLDTLKFVISQEPGSDGYIHIGPKEYELILLAITRAEGTIK